MNRMPKGSAYRRLGDALDRLRTTSIETTGRSESTRRDRIKKFSWISEFGTAEEDGNLSRVEVVPGPSKLGRPARDARRSVIEGILSIVRGGCGWRMLPHDFPPWRLCLLLLHDVAQRRSMAEDS